MGGYSSAATEQAQEFVAEIPVEYASQRKIRETQQALLPFQPLAHLDFCLLHRAGPLTFDLFERGFDSRMALWLGAVLIGTGVAGLRGQLPASSRSRTSFGLPRIVLIRCIAASVTRLRGAR